MVMCKFWKPSWHHPLYKRFHVENADGKCCWVEQGVAELSKRVIVETRGKRKLELADEVKVARFKILRRRAAVVQRIRKEMSSELQSIDRIIHLGGQLNKLKEEIEQVGGVPKSWE